MYFWKAKALARDLKENKVSEKEQMVYYLLVGIAFIIPGNRDISWLEWTILITGVVLGTIWCYQVNKRGDNQNFIVRMTCLSLPVLIRLAVFAEIIGTVIFSIAIIIAHFFLNISFAEIRTFGTYIPSLVYPILLVAYFTMLRFYLPIASGGRTPAENPIPPASTLNAVARTK